MAENTSEDIDTNIENYTVSEMLSILGLNSNPSDKEITDATNKYINQITKNGSGSDNSDIISFFQDMQDTLLAYNNPDTGDNDDNGQAEEWYKNEALEQDNSVQKDKVTDRRQKVDIYDNEHVPIRI